jgi:hypothetical protein
VNLLQREAVYNKYAGGRWWLRFKYFLEHT